MEKIPGSVEAWPSTQVQWEPVCSGMCSSFFTCKRKNTGLEEIFRMFAFSACEQGSALHMCLQMKHWFRVKSVCLILLCLVVISTTCRTNISQLTSKQLSLQQFDVSDKMFQKGPWTNTLWQRCLCSPSGLLLTPARQRPYLWRKQIFYLTLLFDVCSLLSWSRLSCPDQGWSPLLLFCNLSAEENYFLVYVVQHLALGTVLVQIIIMYSTWHSNTLCSPYVALP